MQLISMIGLVSTISALMAQASQAQVTQATSLQTNPTSIHITGTLSAANTATSKQENFSSAAQLTAKQQSPTPQPRLGEKKPTNSAWLLVQMSTPATRKVVQVTGVRLSTRDGLSVFLETADGQKLPAASTRSEGNTLIADIPNSVLALPSGKDFRADNPVTGITTVTVTKLDGNRIRVLVTGKTRVPTAEVVPSQSGLVLILTSQTDSTTEQSTPETSADEQADDLQVEADTDEVPETPQQETAEGEESIEVTVTATRTEEQTQDVPRSVTVINREQIRANARKFILSA